MQLINSCFESDYKPVHFKNAGLIFEGFSWGIEGFP